MTAPRRVRLVLLAVFGVALVGLTLSAAFRDTTPPQLYLEVQTRQAAGRPLNLFASADEPVTYLLEYGNESFEVVAQDHTFEVPALAGAEVARLEATDASGNSTVKELVITGVPELRPELIAPVSLRAGDPLGVRLYPNGINPERVGSGGPVDVDGPGVADGPSQGTEVDVQPDQLMSAQVSDVLLTLDGATLPTALTDGDAGRDEIGSGLVGSAVVEAIVATPMSVEPQNLELVATVIDEFGRVVVVRQPLLLEPLPVEVEQLRISAAVLSVITPDGQALERQVVADAWAAGSRERLWRVPFRMPIAGVNTSGFGDARRYAAGGSVSYHYGLDLAAPKGAPVHATNAGRVLVSRHLPIKGGFIIIDHGAGLMSYYLHQSKLLVEPGDAVAPGDVIGEVGSEGLSTGPHLHWEMRIRGVASNPLVWVDRVFPPSP